MDIATLLILLMYFAPTWTAKRGRRGSIFVVNLFLGWTLIGWVLALFMSVRSYETAKVGAQ
jgi:hypothetical protein